MNFFAENVRIAFDAILSNKLRASITMLIIGIGITALVGTLSAIDAIKNSLNEKLGSMGAGSFTLRESDRKIRIGRRSGKSRPSEKISYRQALQFKEQFHFPARTSVFIEASYDARVRAGEKKTNPNVTIVGSDENYLHVNGYELERGRNLGPSDAGGAAHHVILGKDVSVLLFGRNNPLDKQVRIGAVTYKVIGVLKSKGTGGETQGDRFCLIPLATARQYFSSPGLSYAITVRCEDKLQMEELAYEATGLFRKVRQLSLDQQDDFDLVKSDNLMEVLMEDLSMVTTFATVIGTITLFGAAIGLMNIMLVSVTERTREIGIRKSLGASRQVIRNQFLIESTVICICGGLFGILSGIGIGNLISFSLDTGFFVPWFWILSGILLCVTVGLLSGYLPARKAASLDPIESLRFE